MAFESFSDALVIRNLCDAYDASSLDILGYTSSIISLRVARTNVIL